MSERNLDKPAYPTLIENQQDPNVKTVYGMTKCERAAIELRVPMSGDPDLDAMIREARRLDFAGQALTGLYAMCSSPRVATILEKTGYGTMDEDLTRRALMAADVMLERATETG